MWDSVKLMLFSLELNLENTVSSRELRIEVFISNFFTRNLSQIRPLF